MPCLTNDYNDYNDLFDSKYEDLKIEKANLEAALCTAMTFIESTGNFREYLASSDWKEAGIPPELVQSWWENHKEKDRIRREKEAKAKAAKQKREQDRAAKIAALQSKSWSELTKEELKFLSANVKK